jgi:molecular chaperone DnaJ
MSKSKNYYDVLEVHIHAPIEEIRKSYHRLALKYHPDRNNEPGTDIKFKEINEAAEVYFIFFQY